MTEIDFLATACPSCGAQKGDPCRLIGKEALEAAAQIAAPTARPPHNTRRRRAEMRARLSIIRCA